MISLKNPSSAEYGIKKIFRISFSRASYRVLKFYEYQMNLPDFYSHFPEFSLKISSILLSYVKIVNNSTVEFILNDKKVLLIISILFFWPKLWLNISKFSLLHQKLPETGYFIPL